MGQAFPDSPTAHDGGYTRAQGTQVAGDVLDFSKEFADLQARNERM